ncbi:MAG: glycosyltransferase family 1 protein [Patescibacteria group bacterium]|nr:glycosyltransferase family 1 protein [Patescibacteria group bacterium]
MNIGVDIRCLAERYRTGVGEYTWNLLRRLPRLLPGERFTYFCNAAKPVRLPELAAENVQIRLGRIPSKAFNISVRLLGRPQLDVLCGADAVFLPSLQSVALRRSAKLIVTIHDLSFERYPEFFSPKARLWHRLVNPRWLCQRADAIFATSEHTRMEVVEYYRIPPERITVTPLGVDESFFSRADSAGRAAVRQRYQLPQRYVLTVGNLEPRKNIASVIAAFDRLQPDADLVIVGRAVWNVETLRRLAQKSRLRQRMHFLGYVDAADRPTLYQMAAAFVYPSYYEGFGLPALEAMSSGVPVVAAGTTSLPEVVGDGGLLIDPYDVNDLAAALETILQDTRVRSRCIERGLARARQFTWEETARRSARAISKLTAKH